MPFLANCHIPQTHDCVFFPLYYIHHFSPLTSQTMAAFSFSSSFHFFPNNIINNTSLSLHNPITTAAAATTTTTANNNNLQLQVLELQDHPHQFYHQQNKQEATAPPPPLPLKNNNNINDDELSCVLMSVVPNNNKSTTEIITPNPKRRRRRPKQGAASSTSTPNSTIKVVGDHELKGTGGNNKKRKKKMDEESKESKESWKKSKEKKEKAAAAAGGYVHVRARRGQATDSHSLAERVRRERISERMKLLQALVPGCDKVTGKALMLDEIINYVQSLQNQVEFLSMKLASVNPMLYEFGMDLEPFMLSPLQNTISGNICYPHLDNSINSFGLQQPQILPNAAAMPPQLQGHRQALLWEVEEQRQEIIDETGTGSGTLFSFH